MGESAPLTPAIGTVLAGKYRVDSVLGAGGMGVVLAATHAHLDEQVAIKLLHAGTAIRPGAVERFFREARVAMRLRGEHAVRILDVGVLPDGSPFIVMEHLSGRDLGAVLRDRGRLEPGLAVDYVLQACEAIAEAHALGVVHRDLKPANLFLTARVDGTECVKVLDFGVSKISAAAKMSEALSATSPGSERAPDTSALELAATVGARDTGLTRTHALIGSPRYMAPEQLRSPRDVDARADIWALGVILFELLSGSPPFDGDSLDELQVAVTEREPPTLADVPAPLAAAVAHALAKLPAERYASVQLLAEAIAPFAPDQGRASTERIARLLHAMAGSASPREGQSKPPSQGQVAPSADTLLDGGGTVPPARLRSALRTGAPLAIATIVAIVALGSTVALRSGGPRGAPAARSPAAARSPQGLDATDIERLTFDSGCDEFPSLTPDGRFVVFAAAFGDDEHLVVLDLASHERRVLTHDPGWQMAPAVSPDGAQVVYLTMHGDRRGANVVPFDGSAPPRFLHKGQARPSWSPDGRAVWAGGSEGVERIELAGGSVTRRLSASPSMLVVHTRELRDGRVFAILYDRDVRSATTIVRFDPGVDAPVTLFESTALEEAFALAPDGQRLLFTKVLPTQHAELWQLPVDGAPATSIADRNVEPTRGLAIAGGRAVWSKCTGQQRIALLTSGPDAGVLRAEPLPATEWLDETLAGVPGSATRVVAISDRSAKKEPWIIDLERREDARRLEMGGLVATQPAVSPDGRWLAFTVSGDGIYAMPIDPDGPPHRLTRGATDRNPTFSRSGETVYFETAGEGKGRAVARVAREGGEPRVVIAAGAHPFASPADDRVAYVTYDGEDTGEPRFWDPGTGASSSISRALTKGAYSSVRISGDGTRVAVLAGGKIVEVYAANGAVRGRYTPTDEIEGLTYVGDRIAVSLSTYGGEIWGAKVRSSAEAGGVSP